MTNAGDATAHRVVAKDTIEASIEAYWRWFKLNRALVEFAQDFSHGPPSHNPVEGAVSSLLSFTEERVQYFADAIAPAGLNSGEQLKAKAATLFASFDAVYGGTNIEIVRSPTHDLLCTSFREGNNITDAATDARNQNNRLPIEDASRISLQESTLDQVAAEAVANDTYAAIAALQATGLRRKQLRLLAAAHPDRPVLLAPLCPVRLSSGTTTAQFVEEATAVHHRQ
jgi:hypothetical protein